MVIGCIKEPHVGWTDTVSAAGTVPYAFGMGFSRHDFFGKDCAANIVPCDHVSNSILVATVYGARTPKPALTLFACGSNLVNKVGFIDFFRWTLDHILYQKWDGSLSEPSFKAFTSKEPFLRATQMEAAYFQLMNRVYALPYVGNSDKLRLNQKKLKALMFSAGASLGNERFKFDNHYTDISRYLSLQLLLDEQEKESFDFDLRRI